MTQRTGSSSWGELLGREHVSVATVLAGGVAMYATTTYVTAATLPSIVADIGGEDLYAWVNTGYLTSSVVASMLVTRTMGRLGASRAYLLAFALFGLGTVICAAAPSMAVVIVGRIVQGLGGGLLAGLGFTVIRAALPAHLWTLSAGLVSAMWGVGNLLGPALGGMFAEFGLWRGAFVLLVVIAAGLAAVSRRALAGSKRGGGEAEPFPGLPLTFLAAAAAAFSLTTILPRGAPMAVAIAAGVVGVLAFIVADRRGSHRGRAVLPAIVYRRGNALKWIYLTIALLSSGATAELFVPLFGQELGGLGPLAAGYLGAALSVGWTAGQLGSVNLGTARGRAVVRLLGPVAISGGLVAYGLLQAESAGIGLVAAWALALFVVGTGIGMAFPHTSVAAMSATDDPVQGAKAAAGISTVQLIGNTIASSIAGLLVTLGDASVLGSARWMAFGLAALTALGAVTTALALRRRS